MKNLSRRDFLKATSMTAAATAASLAAIPQILAQDNGRPSTNDLVDTYSANRKSAQYVAVIASTAKCIQAGESCVAHCEAELAQGNTEMAACNFKVHDMLATCQMMLKLASYGSPAAKQAAVACVAACKECKDACFAHSAHWAHGMHLECKACYEACKECEAKCAELVQAA